MRRTRVVLACLLLAGLLPFLPTAASLTWSGKIANGNIGGVSAVLTNPQLAAIGSSTFVSLNYNASSTDFMVTRSTDSGNTWSSSFIDSSTSDLGHFSAIDTFGTAGLISCYIDDTADSIKFAKSNDAGVFWSKQTLFDTADTLNQGCGISAVSSTVYHLVFANASTTSPVFTKSTDGGATWATPKAITVANSCCNNLDPITVASKDATTSIFSYGGANTFNVCRTVNSGANWTCQQLGALSGNSHGTIQYISGDTWMGVFSSSTGVFFTKTEDNGATWGFTNIDTSTDCTAGACDTVALLAMNLTHAHVAYGGDTPNDLNFATSTNGGGSWTIEPVYAAGAVARGLSMAVTTDGDLALHERVGDGINNKLVSYTANLFTLEIAEFAQVTINGLSGFDVDRTGNVIIARLNNGSHIRTYSGTDLSASPIGNVQTSCEAPGARDRVLAHNGEFGGYVAYIVCNVANDTDPTEIHIRNELGADASFANCDFCPSDIELDGFSIAGGDRLLTLGEIVEFPMDFTRTRNVLAGEQHVFAWAWSSSNEGSIGVDVFTTGPGNGHQYSTQAGYATGEPEQICAWERPTDGRQFIVGVDLATTTRIWEFVPEYSNVRTRQEGTIQQRTVLNLNVANARGVGCGNDRVLVLRNNDLTAIEASTGVQEWRLEWEPALIPSARSVALSDDGNWFAYHDSENLYVGNATTGTVTCTLDGWVEGEVVLGMELELHGQQLYVAQSGTPGTITMWAIQQGGCTTEEPTSGDTPGVEDEAGDGLLADSGAQLGSALGIGTFGGNLAIGSMIILAMTGTGVGITSQAVGRFGGTGTSGTVLMVGALIGAIVGVLVAWAFGFLAASAIFAILVLTVLAVYFFRMRSQG